MKRPFKKIPEPESRISGVCSGAAYWLGWPVWAIRTIFLLALFSDGFVFLLYLILTFILDDWIELPKDYEDVTNG